MGIADSPVGRFLGEMRRRRVFRTAAIYIVGTWVVMQVADVVFPALDIPERAIRYVLIAAILGFPAAIVFGWIYDIGVHGIRRTVPAGSDELVAAQPLRRSDYLILTALAFVVAAILYNTVANVVDAPHRTYERVREGPPMVAVLPFTSKNVGGHSEPFAAGVHDDLLTQLSKLQSIRVISRTSVMEYRDTVRNIREIGAALGVDAILEGGVQSAGDRIRINAQLIDARTDAHLWAETYDRELSLANIFDVQSEIARAITSALRATLTEQDAATLDLIPTENMAAYRAYHQAIEIRDNHGSPEEVIVRLQEAVALDPGFTRAWAEMVGSYALGSFSRDEPGLVERAEYALEKIRAIAPESADYLIAKTYYTYYILKDYDLAFDLIMQAQDMTPSDAGLAKLKAFIQRRQGDFEGWVDSLREALSLEPRDRANIIGAVQALMMSHRYDDALAELESSEFEDYSFSILRELLLLREHRDVIRYANAIAELQKEFDVTDDPYNLWEGHIIKREFQAAERLLENMPGNAFDPEPRYAYKFKLRFRVLTHWSLGQGEQLAEASNEVRATLGEDPNSDSESGDMQTILDAALISATEGNTDQTEQLIRRWRRAAAEDLAGMVTTRDQACRILGIAGLAAATVECFRAAFDEPSYVLPFLEPFMPFYDAIRHDPEFVELLAGVDAEQ